MMPLPSVASLTQIVLDATRCTKCGKHTGRRQMEGAGMRYAPESFDPAVHCNGQCQAGE